MRRLLITAAALVLGTAGAMAQSQSFPPPVMNGSGSQVTAPSTYRATAYQNRDRDTRFMKKRTASKHHTMRTSSRRHVMTTGSTRAMPVKNASGSQVTNPATYRANAYQNRR